MASGREDQRNFRNRFIERVGVRGVDSKALEHLLDDDKFDITRVAQYVTRLPLTNANRERLWIILLGLVPSPSVLLKNSLQTACPKMGYIFNQRRRLAWTLEKGLLICGVLKPDDSRATALVLMYLLFNGKLKSSTEDILQTEEPRNLLAITQVFGFEGRFTFDFWIMTEFLKFVKNLQISEKSIKESVKIHLNNSEDSALLRHLTTTGVLSMIPIDKWLKTWFAGFIHETAIIAIWDRLLGINPERLMLCTCVKFITTKKDEIMKENKLQAIQKILEKVRCKETRSFRLTFFMFPSR